MSARDLAAFSATSKANLALARSAHVVGRQRPDEAMRSLWHLAKAGVADTIEQLATNPDHQQLHWGHRDARGATLLMTALEQFSPEVIDALSKAPPALFAGVDDRGDNILHYAIEHADVGRLDRLLKINPELAAYIDLPGHLRHRPYGVLHGCTPLELAYAKRADQMLSCLAAKPVEDIDDAIDQAVDLANARRHEADTAKNRRLTRAFPFDRAGHPIEVEHASQYMSGFRSPRQPIRSRLKLASCAIRDGEFAALERVLASLPADVIRVEREALVRAVMQSANFPSVRVIANCYGSALWEPMGNDETVLHLATAHCRWETFEWLLARADSALALRWRDNAGRTPLLSAATHANSECLAPLVDHHSGTGQIIDIDAAGKGLLRTLFQAKPQAAVWLFQRRLFESRMQRLTLADKTATLMYAIRNLLQHDRAGRGMHTLSPDIFSAHLEMIRQLLSGNRDEIDVHARISPSGESIIDTLRSENMTRIVRQDRQREQMTAVHAFETKRTTLNDIKNLSLAQAHLLRHERRHDAVISDPL